MGSMGDLNANQRRAVQWNDGPLLVLAGPGSGKTYVLTQRVARLIRENADARFRVLALTFTTKAADEMRNRVERLLGTDTRRAQLTTFHSFCAEVLRQHGSHLGLRPNFEILARDIDRERALEEVLRANESLDIPNVRASALVRMIDHLYREGYDGEADTRSPFYGSPRQWIGTIYRAYMRVLISHNHLDYGSLLVCCLRLFRERPRVARHYRIVYPYICVDEYQDTNKCQDLILRYLCPEGGPNLFVVADDDQIIYQWNGASPERLQQLRRDYSMRVIQLPDSYRCPNSVISLANNLIRFNLERSPNKAPLRSVVAEPGDDSIRVRHFRNESEEMEWVAHDIRSRSLRPVDCVVLARNARLLELAAEALRCLGLDPYLVQRRHELRSPPLRFTQSALRLAIAPREIEQMRVLCKAFFYLTGLDVRVEDVEAESEAHGGSLLSGFLAVAEADSNAHHSVPLLDALRHQLVERLRYAEFVDAVFDWYRRDSSDQNEDNEGELDDGEEEILIWNELTREVYRHVGRGPALSRFLQEIDLRPKVVAPRRDAVQCLTIHSAKGREFTHVYLVGLAEDQLPSYHSKKNGSAGRELEEERRGCFVAITRAQSTLTMTHSDYYFGWRKQRSRFLSEMGLS